MKNKLAIVLFLFISFSAHAQKNIRPLKIGDKVPDISFTVVDINGKIHVSKLSDFKGKFVILDFWATWCSPCIKALPKIESLAERFKSKVVPFLVNGRSNSLVEINSFFKHWKLKYPESQISTAFNDSISTILFPHETIPHTVWIDGDRIVKAITLPETITVENLNIALSGENISLSEKREFDEKKPLYLGTDDSISLNNFQFYSLFKKGEIGGLESLVRWRKEIIAGKDIARGYAFRNVPLASIYNVILNALNPTLTDSNRQIINVSKRNDLQIASPYAEPTNLYTYDVFIPSSEATASPKRLYWNMLEDINRFCDYTFKIEQRKAKCLVLVRTSEVDKIKSSSRKKSGFNLSNNSDSQYIKNLPMRWLVEKLNKDRKFILPIVDATNYVGFVNITFDKYTEDVAELKRQLQKYDLDLKEEEREIDMFVISDK